MQYASSCFRLTIIGMWLVAGVNAHAAGKEAAAKDEVRTVIRSQLDAFRKNDFKTAYGFAHSGVKEQFTPLQFEQMVRGGFASMLEPGAMAFSEVQENEAGAEIQLILTDQKGNRSGFQYILEKESGKWRIAAVIPIELPALLV
jgi:hypothetical protein